jgi:hypothetical protein
MFSQNQNAWVTMVDTSWGSIPQAAGKRFMSGPLNHNTSVVVSCKLQVLKALSIADFHKILSCRQGETKLKIDKFADA